MSGGTKEAVKKLLLSQKCRPIAEWGRELNDRRHKKGENMMSALL